MAVGPSIFGSRIKLHALWGHAESQSDIFAFDHTCGALLGSYQCMLLQFSALRICEFLVFRDLPWSLTEMVMKVTFLENSRIIPSVNIKIYGYCNRYKVSYLARFCFLFEFWLLLLREAESREKGKNFRDLRFFICFDL